MEKLLADLLQKLGLAFNEATPLLIRYTVIDCMTTIVAWLIVIGVGAKAVIFFWKRSQNFDSFDRGPLRGVVLVVALIVLVISIAVIQNSITILIEPRGYLINKVITSIRK